MSAGALEPRPASELDLVREKAVRLSDAALRAEIERCRHGMEVAANPAARMRFERRLHIMQLELERRGMSPDPIEGTPAAPPPSQERDLSQVSLQLMDDACRVQALNEIREQWSLSWYNTSVSLVVGDANNLRGYRGRTVREAIDLYRASLVPAEEGRPG